MKEGVKIETALIHAGVDQDKATGAVSAPVYQTSTFAHPSLGETTGFDYSRSENPTRRVLEKAIASLEGGERALAFSSGMAALDCVMKLFRSGDIVAVTEDPYGGTCRLLDKVYRPLGIEFLYIDTSQTDEVNKVLGKNIRAILLESPTNPLQRIANIPEICRMAGGRNVLTIVDNTFLTPYFQRPISLGADIVAYSATKYLSGHNDVLAGLVVARTEKLGEKLHFYQNATGATLGPWDSWLVLRGLKTLSLRMERQQKNAQEIAEWLKGHPRVRKVFYPGLTDHPGHTLLKAQSTGFGSVVSFEVDDPTLVPKILSNVEVFIFAESLGGVESLITFPAVQTHADMNPDVRTRIGINDCLIRLSVGAEAVEDLIEDLKSAIEG
ncbi:MAG TPA: PLP-dependent aspartate aminotransferase family protein [Syntrophorhabdaceae bacterium]|nr:PLP-dependent aspartate aminotransferase family protein [Syntrophorhabdaceae bacterium]